MTLDAKEILEVLPHRYPFLLVDRILELEAGKRIVGMKNVSCNEQFFVGHFPNYPIMPGVLILEFMAQVGGIMLLKNETRPGKLAYLAGVEKARFRKPVKPGDTMIAEITMVRQRAGMGWVKAEAKVDDAIVCEAMLSFALVERSELGL